MIPKSRAIESLYSLLDVSGTWPLRIKLRYSVPSLHLSVKVRPIILGIPYPLTWKSGIGNRINPKWFRWKQLETYYSTWTFTSPQEQKGSTRECWGGCQICGTTGYHPDLGAREGYGSNHLEGDRKCGTTRISGPASMGSWQTGPAWPSWSPSLIKWCTWW